MPTTHGNRSASHLSTFIARHRRALTLVGASIVFSTFLVKEAIRDRVKSTVDALQSAQDVFEIRRQHYVTVRMLNGVTQHVYQIWSTTPDRTAYLKSNDRGDLEYDLVKIGGLILQAEANLDNLRRFIDKLPASEKRLHNSLDDLRARFEQAKKHGSGIQRGIDQRSASKNNEAEWLADIGGETEDLVAHIGDVSNDAVDRSDAIRRHEEKELGFYTVLATGSMHLAGF